MLDLSIIIPAYNEEKKIGADITAAQKFLRKNKLHGEIIVSTDGVTDDTNKIVQKYKSIKLIAKKEKVGKGAAIAAGVKIAQGKNILFADAGLCVPYANCLAGLARLDKNDLAIGSRVLAESQVLRPQPFYRKIGSAIFGLAIISLGIPFAIRDTQCGFKVYKKAVAKKLFGQLKTKGFMFDIEILLRAKKLGLKIGQFPVSWKNDLDTKLKPLSGSFEILKELFSIKFIMGL